MNNAKSEKKSRRSSILKPPKPRQPLQNVELNSSSVDNSPTTTTKVKRRVSFAEKKHVKEFCDSLDQGTMWDNTYEEPDSSHTKNSPNTNKDANNIVEPDASSNDRDNISDSHGTQKNVQISIHTESDVTITRSANKEGERIIVESSTTTVERESNLCDSTERFGHENQSALSLSSNYSKSFNSRRSLSVTEGVMRKTLNKKKYSTLHVETTDLRNSENIEHSKMPDVGCKKIRIDETPIGNLPTESASTIAPEMPIERSVSGPLIVDTISNVDDRENSRVSIDLPSLPIEQIPIFSKQSTETDKIVENATSSMPIETLDAEKTTMFGNESMDLTEAVRRNASPSKPSSERTTIFHDKSLELTEAVKNIPIVDQFETINSERTMIFMDEPVECTEVVNGFTNLEKLENLPQERTTIFHDKSMDFTGIARSIARCENAMKSVAERTVIFNDQPVDMTEVVRSSAIHENRQESPPEKTSIFHNRSMDMTEVVRSSAIDENRQELPPEKTSIFHNRSMEMTEVVRSSAIHENRQEPPPEKTSIFHNRSMDMTEVVRSSAIHENRQESPPEKTSIFQNRSMEMTEVVQSRSNNDQLLPEKSPIMLPDQSQIPNPTKTTLSTKTTPITNPIVPHDLSIENSIQQLHKQVNESSLPPSEPFPALSNVEIENEHQQLETRSNLDPTETIPQIRGLSKLLSRDSCTLAVERRTRHKIQDSTETNRLIATVEVANNDPEVRSPLPKRTKSLGIRKSMDITAAVPFVVYRKLARPQSDETVKNDDSSSNEAHSSMYSNIQSADPTKSDSPKLDPSQKLASQPAKRLQQDSQDKNATLQDLSMDMTQVVPSFQPSQTFPPRTNDPRGDDHCSLSFNTVHNDSMDITIPISGIMETRGPIFIDEPMKMNVEAIPTSQMRSGINVNPEEGLTGQFTSLPGSEDATRIYKDDLMELTKGVQFSGQPPGKNLEYFRTGKPSGLEMDERTKFYRDDLMELTGIVPFPSQTNSQDKENCPVGMEQLQSLNHRKPEPEITISEMNLLGMIKSVPFLSSQKPKENFTSPIVNPERPRTIGQSEMTGVIRFGSVKKSLNQELVTKESVVSIREDKIHQGRHQVAKELFQKPMADGGSDLPKDLPNAGSMTADLDAQIRKLAESFAHSNTVDESDFDQATFLQQQARCMEDYEAHSEASQECPSAVVSALKSLPSFPGKNDRPDGIELDPSMNLAARDISPELGDHWQRNSEGTNTPNHNKDNSLKDCSLEIDENRDRSLEELRYRVNTVKEFQSDQTGFELTAAISLGNPYNGHQSIFAEEPPSFVFSDSISVGCVADGLAPLPRLEVDVDVSLSGREGELEVIRESCGINTPELPEITGIVGNFGGNLNSKNDEAVERLEVDDRRRTRVIKRSGVLLDGMASSGDNKGDERLCGLTTADEFTSESPEGPNEKIRRQQTKGVDVDVMSTIAGSMAGGGKVGKKRGWPFGPLKMQEPVIVEEIDVPDKLPPQRGKNDPGMVELSSKVGKSGKKMKKLGSSAEKSLFGTLRKTIETLAKRKETIWEIKRLDEKVVALNFFSKSIVVAIYLNDDDDDDSDERIKGICTLSQLVEERTQSGVILVHSLMMRDIDNEISTKRYRTYDDVPILLKQLSKIVERGMDFMIDFVEVCFKNIVEIDGYSVSFMVRSRILESGIILIITIDMRKPFDEIAPKDIRIEPVMGDAKIREDEVKNLITNVNKDHTFIRRYIEDVKDYLDAMRKRGLKSS